MIKQFSYLEPLQTSERNIRILESKNNKRKIYKFNENKYKESNWINAWGSKSKYFSDIPLLHSKPYKTACFLKPKRNNFYYRKNNKIKKLIKINKILKSIRIKNNWVSLICEFKKKNFYYLITMEDIVKDYLKLNSIPYNKK
tara:strand:+ start:111 stop:536 length:426 start_codon:yes stop_codon:yes gene_type:complete